MRIKSFAKVNIFLKIVGFRGEYHEIVSRFVKVSNLFDELFFEKSKEGFSIEGDFNCKTKQNSIYKAYNLLKDFPKVDKFFKEHKVRVIKRIPAFAGLGGGSSNAAAFLILANEVLNLKIEKDKLAKIGEKIGADVPFFIYEYNSANISGIGEIVENFQEEPINFDIITPPIKCETPKVYKEFRKNANKEMIEKNKKMANILKNMKSKEILEKFSPKDLNDLFAPALTLCKDLKNYQNEMFFSGSGSSFFKVAK